MPDRRYSGTTSLTLVAAMNRLAGSPIRLAIRPAVRLPKFPLGRKQSGQRPPPAASNARQKVIEELRQNRRG